MARKRKRVDEYLWRRFLHMEWGKAERDDRPKGYLSEPGRRQSMFPRGYETELFRSLPLFQSSAPIVTDDCQPRFLTIQSLHSPRLALKTAISVVTEYKCGIWTAYTPDLNVFGSGETEYEALESLRGEIAELYRDLSGQPLGTALQKVFGYLQSIVQPVRA
jgi:hypothetical protein